MKPRLPLEHRVPNPAPGVTSPDAADLAEHLKRNRVATVFGAGGRSPSEVVFGVLDRAFAAQRDEAIYVALGSGGDRTLAPAFRALAATGSFEPTGAMLQGEGPAACAALVDVADDLGRLIVVDGIVAGDEVWAAARHAARRYSRTARWIFICDERAGDSTATMSVRVEEPGDAARVLPALDGRDQRLVDAVRIVGRMRRARLDEEVKRRGARLVESGHLVDASGHWRVSADAPSTSSELAAARLLVDLGRPIEVLAGADVLIREGHGLDALDALERARDPIIASGSGLHCWELLARVDHRRARQLRLAIAARLNTPRVLDETEPVEDPSPRDRFHMASLMLERGQATDAAAEAARALDAGGDVDPDELHLFLAQAHLARSSPTDALEALARIRDGDATVRFRRDLLRSAARLTTGEEVHDDLDDLVARLDQVTGEHEAAARLDLARLLHLTRRIHDGLRVLQATSSGVNRLLYTEQSQAYVAALLHRCAGDVEEASTIARGLMRGISTSSSFGRHVRLLIAALHADRGELEEAEERSADLVHETRDLEYRALHTASRALHGATALRRRGAAAVRLTDDDLDGWLGPRVRALQTQLELRRGELAADDVDESADLTSQTLATLLGAALVTAGELEELAKQARSRGDLDRAAAHAHRAGLVAVVTPDDEAAPYLERWRRRSREAGRTGSAELADFLHGLWTTASLEDVLARRGPDERGRIATAIVAPDTSDDRVEARLGELVRERRGWRATTLRPGDGWWIVAPDRLIVTPGETFSLAATAVRWRLVTALTDAGGQSTKAALIGAVWGIEDHHPLQDENRLRMAVYKLRQQLGDDEAALIETTDDGYALGAGAILLDADHS